MKDFALLDQNEFQHRLYEKKDKRLVVLYSHGVGCPIVRQQLETLKELKKKYSEFAYFFLINGNTQDDFEDLRQESTDYKLNIPVLKDVSQNILKELEIERTASAIIIDTRDWSILWRGPVNDYTNYYAQKSTGTDFLSNSLKEFEQTGKIKYKNIPAKGCAIYFPEVEELSFNNDIVPILNKKCLQCHYSGGVAPFAMKDYQTVLGWSSMIKEVIQTRRMPPWGINEHFDGVKDDSLFLTAQERKELIHWISFQKKKNKVFPDLLAQAHAEMVASRKTWREGEPDLIIDLPKQNVEAQINIPLKRYMVKLPVNKDIWVSGVEVLPSNSKVLHHLGLFYVPPERMNDKDLDPWRDLKLISGYSSGQKNIFLPQQSGIFLKKGSALFIEQHYQGIGRPQVDQSKLGIYLHKAKPKKEFFVHVYSDGDLIIQPHKKNQKIVGEIYFSQEGLLTRIFPHMHLRGHSMNFYLDNGKNKERVLSVSRFNYNFQTNFELEKPLKIKPGTKLIAEGIYDNSPMNPLNPDPNKTVRYGTYTEDEMFWFHAEVVTPTSI